ncbi:hypothetical protein BDZ85DRAFT_21284 [Elsinoe ampelina]|uniref:Secreted protein n=1 Tax=Elsinoe ampelina TaxID=302913 RepID=A0A6A6G592_9PEZI|nr:hypothetical protein BDZ85DRAFT_21284 [Elsinoe ampelina]
MTSGGCRSILICLVTVWSRRCVMQTFQVLCLPRNDNKPSLSSMLIVWCIRPNRNRVAAKMSMTTSLYEAFDVLRIGNS